MQKSMIGDIAELIGVSANTIRKYERKGLIQMERNPENNYRLLDDPTIGLLVRMRELKQIGFGFEHMGELIFADTIQDITRQFEEKKHQLEEEIVARQQLMSILDRWSNEIGAESVSWGTMPTYRYLKFKDISGLTTDREAKNCLRAWFKNMPETFPGLLFSKNELLSGLSGYKFDTCLFCPEILYTEKKLLQTDKSKLLSKSPCLIYTDSLDENFVKKKTSRALHIIEDSGWQLGPYAFGELIATTKGNSEDEYISWCKFYIPVEK